MCCGAYSGFGRLLWSLFLILAGTALLLHTLGWWRWQVWHLWPLWLIFLGLVMLLDRRPRYWRMEEHRHE